MRMVRLRMIMPGFKGLLGTEVMECGGKNISVAERK